MNELEPFLNSLLRHFPATEITSIAITGFIIIQIVRNPDNVMKWASIFNKILADLGLWRRRTHRNYVRFDLQSRINLFTKEVTEQAPYLEDVKIKVEWIDTDTDKASFLSGGKAVIRLRRDDPEDLNFVHGAYWAVSARLLPRVKRYVSATQKIAIDVYVTGKVIEKQKFHVREHFLDHYLEPFVDNDEQVKEFFNQIATIDLYGAFYPIFLQELYFLGMKIYGGLQNNLVIDEVTQLAAYLHRIAVRRVGEEMKEDFFGQFCKFGIVIVGTGEKMSLEGTKPYVRYVERVLLPKKAETIYILGKHDYQEFINDVCEDLYMNYDILRKHVYDAHLSFEDGGKLTEKTYLVVLRYLDAEVYEGRSIHDFKN